MNEARHNPHSTAEKLIKDTFSVLEQRADPVIARLHFEHRLKEQFPRRPRVRVWLKLAAYLTALVLLGGWATNMPLPAWDDGEQITFALPDSFTPSDYPHWVAVFANHADELRPAGGHGLVVDYKEGRDGAYYLELGLVGVGYAQANDWIRRTLSRIPELRGTPYAINQPVLPYRTTVGRMIAYKLGGRDAVERYVLEAWKDAGENPSKNGFVYVIARPSDYARRVSMIDY